MEIPTPPACSILDVTFLAETDEAFEAACLGIGAGEPQVIENTTKRAGEAIAYSYRIAWGRREGYTITLRGPRREMKLVPLDV